MIYFQFFWPFALILGLCIGSFLNVCIYRIPIQMSIAKGSSICPTCNTPLKALDLIPVFSFLFLRGKCRHCKSKISIIYPVIELLCAALFVLSFYVFGMNVLTLFAWAFISVLIVASAIDIKTFELPNGISIFIAVLGILSFFFPYIMWWERLLGVAASSLPLLLIVLISKGNAMGMGDVKLMAAAGLLLGWKLGLLALFLSVLAGGIIGAILLLTKKRKGKDAIPFVPMLCIGTILAFLFGNTMLNWYFSLLG